MAQSVKCPTLDLNPGHDLAVPEFEPHVGLCTEGTELVTINTGEPRESNTIKINRLGYKKKKKTHLISYFAYPYRLVIRNTNNNYAYHLKNVPD